MIQASLVAKAYRSLLDLSRNANATELDLHYVTTNMAIVTPDSDSDDAPTPTDALQDFFRRGEIVATYLDQIQTVSPYLLERIMRSFYALYRGAEIKVPQIALNRMWETLKPLWKLAQFEQRYVWPHLIRQQ